jgi:serine phosphatase RsbU (regulator of sigma subunit)
VVSGDFYWAAELNNGNFALCCADSTGHGVPGAIMSILNISSLEKSIEKYNSPSGILNETRKIIIERLKKDGSVEGGKDGMDASLIVLNKEKTKLVCAAANNPIWIIRNHEIIEMEPDKMPVGKHDKDRILFTEREFDLQKGDLIFLFTDGFADQFGGPKGKKFKYSNLKELFLENANIKLETLNLKLATAFTEWRGDLEQVDDVCVIGVRI